MTDPLQINVFSLGDWQTNCYVAAAGSQCWLIDAGFEPKPMIAFVTEQELQVQRILMTHAHVDHIAGLHEVKRHFPDAPILIHEAEATFLTDPKLNLSAALAEEITAPPADQMLADGQMLQLAEHSFKVLHTPGHSPGGVTFYCADQGVAFVGDALFAGSIGRFDFPTSDGQTLVQSIHEKLLTLPDETRILPGHGPASTIGHEKQTNPYLR